MGLKGDANTFLFHVVVALGSFERVTTQFHISLACKTIFMFFYREILGPREVGGAHLARSASGGCHGLEHGQPCPHQAFFLGGIFHCIRHDQDGDGSRTGWVPSYFS